MNVIPVGQPADVEVTLSTTGLFVGLAIFDDSGLSPVQLTSLPGMVNGILPADNFYGTSYRAKFSGSANIWYLVHIAVYTDNTYMVIDSEQPQGSDSVLFTDPVDLIIDTPAILDAINKLSTGQIEGIILAEDNEAIVAIVDECD